METLINKNNMVALKNDIKKLAEEQKLLKNQRKTVNLKGERTMEPWEATFTHKVNRENLRIMYAAYGLMRGKTFSQIENHFSEEEHPLCKLQAKINAVVFKYKTEEVLEEVE